MPIQIEEQQEQHCQHTRNAYADDVMLNSSGEAPSTTFTASSPEDEASHDDDTSSQHDRPKIGLSPNPREKARFVMFYRVTHGLVDIPLPKDLLPMPCKNTRNFHPKKYRPLACNNNYYMGTFFPSTVNIYTAATLGRPNIAKFKDELDYGAPNVTKKIILLVINRSLIYILQLVINTLFRLIYISQLVINTLFCLIYRSQLVIYNVHS